MPQFADPVQINLVPLRDLKPSTRNARTHSKKQINQIANSIVAFGWTYPILVDENGNIIAGFGRYLAAEQLGLTKVPVIVICGLSDAEKRALALADNKIAANSGWNRAVVATELGDLATLLPECNLDLEITGFEPAEFDALVADFGGSEGDPVDEIPTIERIAVSRNNDVWALGDHRLVCGDAGSNAHASALMGRDRAAMVFADPPTTCKSLPLLDAARSSTVSLHLHPVKCRALNSLDSSPVPSPSPRATRAKAPFITSAWIGATLARL
jgi:hypothetical protein